MTAYPKKFNLDPWDITERFVRASGPGGQNVNKVATAVELRFDLAGTRSLPEDAKHRLKLLAGTRVTGDGSLVIEARRFRTQEANRADARQRLISLIGRALQRPKVRKPTKPSRAATERRLEEKKWRGQAKRHRVLSREEE
jgi:ribosome-associated protein